MKSLSAALALVLLLSGSVAGRSQAPPPPPPDSSFDPYRAEKNVEIGMYYLKKRNYDAAIERFQDATRYKPRFARAYRLLGEAYDKKGEKAEAVKSYQKYLEILPSAEDVGKVRKRIDKLSRELDRAARGRSG